jgi:hypothetical protein
MSCTVGNLGYTVAQSITTRYLGPTNRLGGRIKATSTGGMTITRYYDHSGIEAFHAKVAMILAGDLGWDGEWIMGGLDDNGYVFVRNWKG